MIIIQFAFRAYDDSDARECIVRMLRVSGLSLEIISFFLTLDFKHLQ